VDDNRELLARAYSLFNVRDIEDVLRLMDPDVDWPNGMEGGRVHGHDEVRDYWKRQWAIYDPHVQPIGFRDGEDGETVVIVHQVVRDMKGTVLVDQLIDHAYWIENSLIIKMEIRDHTEQ